MSKPSHPDKTVTHIYLIHSERDTKHSVYIGKTDDMTRRFKDHKNSKKEDRVGCWMRKYRSRKMRMVLLETVPMDEWRDAEIFWIAYYRSIGANVINQTDGGEGFAPDAETKERWLHSLHEAMARPEYKERQKIAQKKKWDDDPKMRMRHSEIMKKAYSDPEKSARRNAATKEGLNRPEVRAKTSARAKEHMSKIETKIRLSGYSTLEEVLARRDMILELKSKKLRACDICRKIGDRLVYTVFAGTHWSCKLP